MTFLDQFQSIRIYGPSDMSWLELVIRVLVQFGIWFPVLALLVAVSNWDTRIEERHRRKKDDDGKLGNTDH